MEFKDRLKLIIETEKVPKGLLAEQCGVHRNSVASWLRGESEPNLKVIRLIKKHFPKVDLEWLITGKGRRYDPNPSLGETHPPLVGQWHHFKNRDLTPRDVKFSSRKKVWWVCKKGHEWQATVSQRVKGGGCERCGGKK